MRKSVAICDSQPIAAEGLRSVLAGCPELEFAWATRSIAECMERLAQAPPGVLVLDKAFGTQAVISCLELVRTRGWQAAPVVWGVSITEAEALRFLQAGARGVLRKTDELESLRNCLLAVASNAVWITSDKPQPVSQGRRPSLTQREQQVLELVGQGMKNREIASELGIRPGTVKVHLKHIFEKTGVRSRYGLALAGWSEGRRRVPE